MAKRRMQEIEDQEWRDDPEAVEERMAEYERQLQDDIADAADQWEEYLSQWRELEEPAE